MMPSEPAIDLPQALVERFRLHLAGVASEVTALGADLPSSQVCETAILERLRMIAHKLAGTAGPYGFPALGNAAHALEIAIRADPNGSAPATMLHLDYLGEQLSLAAASS